VIKARTDILNLESAMQDMEGYDPEGKETCRITHYFAPGVYAREMWMPQGCLITGKIHKTEHLNMLSQGKVSVSNQGDSITMEAPYTFVSPVGTKRAIYAHEDSTWTTIHATELTDPDEIEAEIIAETFEELDYLIARDDYEKFLIEYSLTEDDVQNATHRDNEVIELISCEVRDSAINGQGLFCNSPMIEGDYVPAMIDGKRTVAGRYVNHSGNPNAKIVLIDAKNVRMYAAKEIRIGEEITTDYRETLKVQGWEGIHKCLLS